MSGERKPRILFINHWAGRLGGAEYSLLDILACAASRCEAHLVTSEPGPLVAKAEKLGIHTHVVPCNANLSNVRRESLVLGALLSLPGLWGFGRYVLRVARLIKRIDPCLVHANVPKSHVTAFALAFLGYRGRFCFHMREIFPRNSFPYQLYRILFPRRSGRIIAISRTVCGSLPARLRKAATVIYNGVPIPQSVPVKPSTPPVKFIYLGRIVPWKGCHLLVEAFSGVVQRLGPGKACLSLVGDTSYWTDAYRGDLQDLIERHLLAPACQILPHTNAPLAELSSHHVFCNASVDEPFGRSLAEAQACGLPVVAFDSGGVSEIVDHRETGILVKFGDMAALADAMAELADNPSMIPTMGDEGRKRASVRFNRDVQAPALCDFVVGCGTPD